MIQIQYESLTTHLQELIDKAPDSHLLDGQTKEEIIAGIQAWVADNYVDNSELTAALGDLRTELESIINSFKPSMVTLGTSTTSTQMNLVYADSTGKLYHTNGKTAVVPSSGTIRTWGDLETHT